MSGHTANDLVIWLHMVAKYFQVDIKLIVYRLVHPYEEPELDIENPVDKIVYYTLHVLFDESSAIKESVRHFADLLFQDRMITKNCRVGAQGVVYGWKEMIKLAKLIVTWELLVQATWFQDHAKFLTTNVLGLRLFISKSGRAGLGPKSISDGDVISQPDGRDVCYCLRPISPGHYSLLGRAFFSYSYPDDGPFMKHGLNQKVAPEWQSIFLV